MASKLSAAVDLLQQATKDYGKKATIYARTTTTDAFGETAEGDSSVKYSNLSVAIKRRRFPPPELVSDIKVNNKLYDAVFNLKTDADEEVTLTEDYEVKIEDNTYKILNLDKEITGWVALLLKE